MTLSLRRPGRAGGACGGRRARPAAGGPRTTWIGDFVPADQAAEAAADRLVLRRPSSTPSRAARPDNPAAGRGGPAAPGGAAARAPGRRGGSSPTSSAPTRRRRTPAATRPSAPALFRYFPMLVDRLACSRRRPGDAGRPCRRPARPLRRRGRSAAGRDRAVRRHDNTQRDAPRSSGRSPRSLPAPPAPPDEILGAAAGGRHGRCCGGRASRSPAACCLPGRWCATRGLVAAILVPLGLAPGPPRWASAWCSACRSTMPTCSSCRC